MAADRVFHFRSVADMTATSMTVIRGRITDARRGLIVRQDEVTYTRRVLTLQVERSITGRAVGKHVLVEIAGWRQVADEPETELRLEGDVDLRSGDRGVFFLYDFEGDDLLEPISEQGVVPVDAAGRIRHTPTDDPLMHRVEATSLAVLENEVEDATALVRAGRLRPTRALP